MPGLTGGAIVSPAPLNLSLFVSLIGSGSCKVFELESLRERATPAVPLEDIDADGY